MWTTLYINELRKLSFIFSAIILLPFQSLAHEITPNIADISINRKSITVELRFNVEAFLARIDLSLIQDTDDAEQISNYKNLRTLNSDSLSALFQENWQHFSNQIEINSSTFGKVIKLDFVSLSVPYLEELDLPRLSIVTFNVNLPDVGAVTFRLSEIFGSTILRQFGVEEGLTQYLAPGQTSDAMQRNVSLRKSSISRLGEYTLIGFYHVVPHGLDHILFVLGLFLLSLKTSILLWQISAFTLAHTLTLIASAFGIISINSSIVEPLIAASIVYISVENIFFSNLNKWRTVIVFALGLLHGLGFATVLAEFGLPTEQFLPALIGFNIGVELGQLSVIFIAYLLIGLLFGKKQYYRSFITIPASCIIALTGCWWVFERTFIS